MPRFTRLLRFIARIGQLCQDPADAALSASVIHALNTRYALAPKMSRERGVEEVVAQVAGRLIAAFGSVSRVRGLRILDIACGSNSSRAPAAVYIDTPQGVETVRTTRKGYAAKFEPWFCRMVLELGAQPVGVDFGDLDAESFEHYRVDLGKLGALDFLPGASFDAVQDSRLFGSPEFTAQFPNEDERRKIAAEIVRQEQRLLKPNGIVVHSDAAVISRKVPHLTP